MPGAEREPLGRPFGKHLQAHQPFTAVARLDVPRQVASRVLRVGTENLDRLVNHHQMRAVFRVSVELHNDRLAGVVAEANAVNAKALHCGLAECSGAVVAFTSSHATPPVS